MGVPLHHRCFLRHRPRPGLGRQGYTAADIDPLARGVGWLLSETGIPRRIKTAWLTDADIKYLAAYAARLRGTHLAAAPEAGHLLTAATAALAPDPPTARDRERTPTTPRPSPGPTSAPGNASSPAPAACTRPIRLRGRTDVIDLATGETAPLYDTADEPGGVLTVPCGNRREAVCPPCSAVYKRDARQLVRAGLAGGKGIPGSITAHPCVFATLTAPSFGPVPLPADARQNHPALPPPPRRQCAALPARPRTSPAPPATARISPARPANVPRLLRLPSRGAVQRLRRRPVAPVRHLPAPASSPAAWASTQKRLRALVRIRYVKVAEYQARGVVHFHAVIRWTLPGEDYQPPPPGIDAAMLGDAIGQAVAAVRLPVLRGVRPRPAR